MVEGVGERVDTNLEIGLGSQEVFAYGIANLAVGTDEEDGFQGIEFWQVNELVVHRCGRHGISSPNANILVLQVWIRLHHIRNELSSVIQLLHFVQVPKSEALRSISLVLRGDKLDNILIHGFVTLWVDVVNGSATDANDTADELVVDHVSGASVRRHDETNHGSHHVAKEKLHLIRKVFECLEWTVRRIDIPLRTRQEVGKTCIVPNEDKVLLLRRKKVVRIRLLIGSPSTKDVVPNRHEQSIICTKEGMMTQMKLWSVKQVLKG
mmetsp:Transcript_17449/g.37762  ORF Transcript_17449/g.37762 Transcript_17449/m.37762 type:complete len:266 (+) Transcript_17449:561-1358(+)